jgi:hypothetical protein
LEQEAGGRSRRRNIQTRGEYSRRGQLRLKVSLLTDLNLTRNLDAGKAIPSLYENNLYEPIDRLAHSWHKEN